MTKIKPIKEEIQNNKNLDQPTLILKTSIGCSEGPYPFQF